MIDIWVAAFRMNGASRRAVCGVIQIKAYRIIKWYDAKWALVPNCPDNCGSGMQSISIDGMEVELFREGTFFYSRDEAVSHFEHARITKINELRQTASELECIAIH